MTASAVFVSNLHKSYGEHVVLDGLDLDVRAGSVFALLGPNGAGKTTTIRILATLLTADRGVVRVAGHDPATDPDAVRRAIGVTGQFAAVDDLFTGRENLDLMADLHHLGRAGRGRTAELLERFDLVEAADRPASTYSGGMRRRLDLAMGLVGRPDVLFLDEPTTGLDPRTRRSLWALVRELTADGVTVVLTTQYLEEADQLADRVAVLDGGRIVAVGTPEELKRRVGGGHVRLRFTEPDDVVRATDALPGATADPAALTVRVPGEGFRALRAVIDRLDAVGLSPEDLAVHSPDLDDVFLTLTGKAAS